MKIVLTRPLPNKLHTLSVQIHPIAGTRTMHDVILTVTEDSTKKVSINRFMLDGIESVEWLLCLMHSGNWGCFNEIWNCVSCKDANIVYDAALFYKRITDGTKTVK